MNIRVGARPESKTDANMKSQEREMLLVRHARGAGEWHEHYGSWRSIFETQKETCSIRRMKWPEYVRQPIRARALWFVDISRQHSKGNMLDTWYEMA